MFVRKVFISHTEMSESTGQILSLKVEMPLVEAYCFSQVTFSARTLTLSKTCVTLIPSEIGFFTNLEKP